MPERLAIKHGVYAEIEPALAPGIVATSASGLTLSEMQAGWKNPARFVLGHPFNPPHLIPLVEVMGNARTATGVVEAAEAFYQQAGRITVHVYCRGARPRRRQPAAGRRLAAIHLVKTGVASVEDVDQAMWAGPGLRWAAMGPTMLFHLGAGEGGLKAFCERYTDSFNRWWDDLGVLHLDAPTAETLVNGMTEATAGQSQAELSTKRDALITAIQKAMSPLRQAGKRLAPEH